MEQETQIELRVQDFRLLLDAIEKLKYDMARTEHAYRRKLVENDLSNFVCEMWNFMGQCNDKIDYHYVPTIYEEITSNFFGLLIKHYKEEHEVSFYAGMLNVMPVYLSRAIKKTTNQTAMKLISDFILIESKIMLRKPNVTIQEVADELNFSDQASFSEFFKKYTGESPLAYKNSL